jgi:predicted ATPase
MLLRFMASNHRSILEPIELSMIAVDEERPSVHRFGTMAERAVSIAGIYGPNASGKSNVLDAISWLSSAVERSLRTWEDMVPRQPFKFGSGPLEPSGYEIEMAVDGVRYIYRLGVDDSNVLVEGLYSYPERRRRILFEREGTEIRFRRGLGTLSGTRELLTPTTLALSAAMRFDEPEVRNFGRAVANIQTLRARRRSPGLRGGFAVVTPWALTERLFDEQNSTSQSSLFEDPETAKVSPRDSALALLRFADLGIDDVQIVEDEVEVSETSGATHRVARRRPRLLHRAAGQEVPFELSEESVGTQTWFQLIGPILRALRSGRVLLVDEIDASLHPTLSARLLELFQDPITNPMGAQLVFTTHDTNLLNYLNRDEVWLTEKGENGATSLTALAEFAGDKVRRSLNLEKAYLRGRFGAVPDLDQFALRQVLGLESSSN